MMWACSLKGIHEYQATTTAPQQNRLLHGDGGDDDGGDDGLYKYVDNNNMM